MNTTSTAPVIRDRIPRSISPSVDGTELFCERRVEFRELADEDAPLTPNSDDGIRIYGSHACAVLQLRGVSALTRKGRPRRLIATASYLDKREVRALIIKLTEIETTLEPQPTQPKTPSTDQAQ
jgi:hypothetical protein